MDRTPKAWPHNTHEKLIAAGYVWQGARHCAGRTCAFTVHWYFTPHGKRMPFNFTPEGKLEPHFAWCPDVKEFKREKRA